MEQVFTIQRTDPYLLEADGRLTSLHHRLLVLSSVGETLNQAELQRALGQLVSDKSVWGIQKKGLVAAGCAVIQNLLLDICDGLFWSCLLFAHSPRPEGSLQVSSNRSG